MLHWFQEPNQSFKDYKLSWHILLKDCFLPYWIQTKSPRQSVFTLKFGQTKMWQLRRLLLFNDDKYYHSNIFPHRVSFQKQGGEQWELVAYGFAQRSSITYPMVCVKIKFPNLIIGRSNEFDKFGRISPNGLHILNPNTNRNIHCV